LSKTGAAIAFYSLISDRNAFESSFSKAKAASVSVASAQKKAPAAGADRGLA
jgi:hypothetical protein